MSMATTAPVTARNRVLPFDPLFVSAVLCLILIGFVMISSASIEVAAVRNNNPFFYMIRHGVFILLGLAAAIVVLRIPISFWQRSGPWLLLVGFVLLVLVLAVGREINGSVRWISLGPVNLQASEVAKFAMVIYLAGYLVRRLTEVRSSWKGIAKPALPLAFFVFLMILEPDFGAAVVLMGSVMGMIFLGGMKFSQFALIVIGCAVVIPSLAMLQPYRVVRLKTFLDPWADPFGSGYQLAQAQIAFGRGDWFGEGLGNSVQKLFYLPEAHTDFVFSVLAEEMGLVFALLVVCLYGLIAVRMFRIGRRAEKLQQFFMAYIAYGFAIMLTGQALINIGVNVGALPTKGLTLPLVSYGGSSLVVSCVMIAIVMRVDYELKRLLADAPAPATTKQRKKTAGADDEK
ncbi:cell division-specific peptidoglycan biosynthesis regulator FtsW [Amphritea atlantica]|uniref:Probable peptidoglycan glycosyltransferase FtsW n=1 Tax=Amphritea atlantica TaxID=355243 RepID=A0A1H9M1U1_9GAMM|nr:putative lipid II flippase FtsW [Amphritea atlantica]SER17656.1 cell division-specific peptidoglycan biosynthesis regulator FtsW [Amphritea atlantica]